LANQLNVQVEEIEKPPYEINDNTDDVLEPRPAAIAPPSVRSSKAKREGLTFNGTAYMDGEDNQSLKLSQQ